MLPCEEHGLVTSDFIGSGGGSGRKYKRCHRGAEGRIEAGHVTPMRSVPAGIERPDYAETGEPILPDDLPLEAPGETGVALTGEGRLINSGPFDGLSKSNAIRRVTKNGTGCS